MNLLFRIMLTIYATCLLLASMVAMVFTLRPGTLMIISNYITQTVLPNPNGAIALFVIELLFLALSLIFLMSGVRQDPQRKAMVKQTHIGEIKISLNAIETIVLSCTKKITGMKETKATVKKHGDQISIAVRATVMADIHIPALLEEVQTKVKKTVEELTEIKILDITVSVDNVHAGYRNRVE